MHNRISAMLTSLLMAVLVLTATAQSMQPWLGTWKLNLAKGVNRVGVAAAPPTANTTVLDMVNGVMRITADAVSGDGVKTHTVTMAAFDGKEHPVEGAALPTTRTFKWVDDHHYEWVTKVNGRVTTTTRLELSRDGKTQTLVTTGKSASAQQVDNTSVFERQ
jgi:hypothetical protein